MLKTRTWLSKSFRQFGIERLAPGCPHVEVSISPVPAFYQLVPLYWMKVEKEESTDLDVVGHIWRVPRPIVDVRPS